jgi:hypothetical protein
MLPVCAIKAVIVVRPTRHQPGGSEFAQLILDGVKGKIAELHQFSDVTLFCRN